MATEVHVPTLAVLPPTFWPLVSSQLRSFGGAAVFAYVHSRSIVAMAANVFFVPRMLHAEGHVIQPARVVVVVGNVMAGVPLVFPNQLVVYKSHGN